MSSTAEKTEETTEETLKSIRKFATIVFFSAYMAREEGQRSESMEHIFRMHMDSIVESKDMSHMLNKIKNDEKLAHELKDRGIYPLKIQVHDTTLQMSEFLFLTMSRGLLPLHMKMPSEAKPFDFILAQPDFTDAIENKAKMCFYVLDESHVLPIVADKPPSESDSEATKH